MFTIKIETGKITILTDHPEVQRFLERELESYQYCFYTKKVEKTKVRVSICRKMSRKPDKNGVYKYILGLGWIPYIMNIFSGYMSGEDYNRLRDTIVSDTFREAPFPELRDYQNSDVLFLLKYKIGLFQCNTGYGKTQTISVLAKYFLDQGKKVLLVTPGNKARDELVKRINSLYGVVVEKEIGKGNISCIITSGLGNKKEYKTKAGLKKVIQDLSQYNIVMVDEVEYTINSGGKFIYDKLSNAERFYGFSGTADKYSGEAITFHSGLTETVLRNRELISYFGPALVYRMPLNIVVNNVSIVTESLNHLEFTDEDFKSDNNVYMTVMTKMWTNPEIKNILTKICKHFPMSFIPMNNLEKVITEWIDYWKGVFRILLICYKGYVYYDLSGNEKVLNLEEACDYIKKGLVDVIPSTSSGYRALDLPGLKNIILCQGKIAGVVLQSVGRTARGQDMNIITMEPRFPARIPIYSKGVNERDSMIRKYYKYCTINDITINEEDL